MPRPTRIRRIWLAAEVTKLRTLAVTGLPSREIGRRLARTPQAVRHQAARLRIQLGEVRLGARWRSGGTSHD
jgi:hypothetical protein